MVSSVPELKTVVFRVTFLPSCLAKKPFSRPTSAGSWVMLARKPSRSTTGLEPPPDASWTTPTSCTGGRQHRDRGYPGRQKAFTHHKTPHLFFRLVK